LEDFDLSKTSSKDEDRYGGLIFFISNESIFRIPENLRRLKKFNLHVCYSITGKSIIKITECASNLQILI
jgi:hypothetical protein